MKPEISVIIPTLGNRDTLELVLKALAGCIQKPGSVEVLIADNTPDGHFAAGARQRVLPESERVVSCPKPGAASARNKGAAEASGRYLLFLDDDVVPKAGLIEAHLNCLKNVSGRISMGKLLPAEYVKNSIFGEFSIYRLFPDYRKFKEGLALSCQHFNSANFMVKKEDFLGSGGFDEGFDCYGWEDVEFGRRILKNGRVTVFCDQALAVHYVDSSLAGYLKKMKLMGISAVRLVKNHPELSKLINILNYDSDRGVFRYNITEITKLELEENGALKACREFTAAAEQNAGELRKLYNFTVMQELVFECYALLLRHEYLSGLKEAFFSLSSAEREGVTASFENFKVEKQCSLKEEAAALRGVIEYQDKHPVKHLLGRLKEKYSRRQKAE
ncbi:MAG: glycosyltransferase [Candidatus Firestonebacteria bacterium]